MIAQPHAGPAVLRIMVSGVLVATLLGAALLLMRVQPTAAPAPMAPDIIHGVWVPVDVQAQAAPGPFSHAWVAITATGADQVRLSWAQDGVCAQTTGHLFGHAIQIIDPGAWSAFTVLDRTTATATVSHGDRTWTQRYRKQRTTIPACDWLLR